MFHMEYKQTDYGLSIAIKGLPSKSEILSHIMNLKTIIDNMKVPFHILLDFSDSNFAMTNEALRIIEMGRIYMMSKGCDRIVVLYRSSADIVDLFTAFNEMSILKRERYISNMINKDALKIAERYLLEGVEP